MFENRREFFFKEKHIFTKKKETARSICTCCSTCVLPIRPIEWINFTH